MTNAEPAADDDFDDGQLERIGWPIARIAEALALLASHAGLAPRSVSDAGAPPGDDDRHALGAWLETLGGCLGIEVEAVISRHADLPQALAALGTALVRLGNHVIVVLSSNAETLRVLPPSRVPERLPTARLRSALTAHLRTTPAVHVDKWIAAARLSGRRAARARDALLGELVADRPIGGLWLVRPDLGMSFWRLLWLRGSMRRALVFLTAQLAQVALGIAAWALVGKGTLAGGIEAGFIWSWALLSLTALPLQVLATWTGGQLALDAAALLKQRLLAGALRLPPEAIRSRGAGGLLAMVAESEAVESAGLGGALRVVLAMVQLVTAAFVLGAGAGGGLAVSLLVAWATVVTLLIVVATRRRAAWTAARFGLTNTFVENVVGNRTRLAQQPPHLHHVDEDAQLARYQGLGRAMDRVNDPMAALPARGWLLVGLLGLLPSLLTGDAQPAGLLVGIGGILQAQIAFGTFAQSLSSILGALVSFRSIAPLFAAAARLPAPGLPQAAVGRRGTADVVLEARRIGFRYRAEGPPVLNGCDLVVRRGERLLIEGPSGGGKSTLAAILSGLRTPTSGLVLLGGLDAETLGGAAWRQRVANAPQFHENHILSGTLAFNLLLGRSWPPTDGDRSLALRICRELDLGPLLERMPAGLDQAVGETGWQLSHGERSRVFLARALLARADVMILDETFGALDPVVSRRCVDAVLARAPALLVIAHP